MFYKALFKVKKIILPFVCLLVFYSCKETSSSDVGLFDSLVGTWKLEDDSQYERWTKNEDGSYLATGFTTIGTDTLISEKVKIYKKGSEWCFETLVSGQNDETSVVFTSAILNDTVVQFENKKHDFPNIINYRLLYQNSLRAFIAGKADTIYFNYSRVRL
jgi:hypothetical protein